MKITIVAKRDITIAQNGKTVNIVTGDSFTLYGKIFAIGEVIIDITKYEDLFTISTEALPSSIQYYKFTSAVKVMQWGRTIIINKDTVFQSSKDIVYINGAVIDIAEYAHCLQVIQPPIHVNDIDLTPKTATLQIGATLEIEAYIAPSFAGNKTIVWSSSDETKATVDDGVVTAITAGEVTITATTVDGELEDTCTVTVIPVPITSISILPDTSNLTVGDVLELTGTVLPANANQAITWSSSDETKATVVDGMVTAIDAGEVTITGTASDGTHIDTSVITVIAITAVTVTPEMSDVVIGETIALTAAVAPETASQVVTWSSSDETKATVVDGIVTGIAEGSVTITATAIDGTHSDMSIITVVTA